MKRRNHKTPRRARQRGSAYGGDGWGFDLMTLDQLLECRRVAEKASRSCAMPADQIAALAAAIEEARKKPQTVELKIGDGAVYVDVEAER